MIDEAGTDAAAKNYIRNKRQFGLLMTIGDVNDCWRETEREREEKRKEREGERVANKCSFIIRFE